MYTIWDRNPSKSEVIGRCGGDETTEWPRKKDKSRTLKNIKKLKKLPVILYIGNVQFHSKLLRQALYMRLKPTL